MPKVSPIALDLSTPELRRRTFSSCCQLSTLLFPTAFLDLRYLSNPPAFHCAGIAAGTFSSVILALVSLLFGNFFLVSRVSTSSQRLRSEKTPVPDVRIPQSDLAVVPLIFHARSALVDPDRAGQLLGLVGTRGDPPFVQMSARPWHISRTQTT